MDGMIVVNNYHGTINSNLQVWISIQVFSRSYPLKWHTWSSALRHTSWSCRHRSLTKHSAAPDMVWHSVMYGCPLCGMYGCCSCPWLHASSGPSHRSDPYNSCYWPSARMSHSLACLPISCTTELTLIPLRNLACLPISCTMKLMLVLLRMLIPYTCIWCIMQRIIFVEAIWIILLKLSMGFCCVIVLLNPPKMNSY